jgi:prepilin-type N-terminal cleavage/methylation domain-containing protein/prepilin-type processing-associated H-X9-DG protein
VNGQDLLSVTRSSSRRAVTLIELMVVISIIGVLAALIVPAVAGARETMRRNTCAGHLRQIGIAINGYNATYRRLPYGCMEWRANAQSKGRQLAWSATILPFLDSAIVAEQIDFKKAYDDPANAKAAATTIPVYLCPSVERKTQVRGASDYGGIFGQRLNTRTNTDNGVFIYNRSFSISEIKDGLVNTMAVAEDSAGPDSEWINGRNVFEQSGLINDPNAWIGDNEIRSLHPGGAMTLFCDGTPRFLSNSTDRQTLAAMITRAGKDIAKFNE